MQIAKHIYDEYWEHEGKNKGGNTQSDSLEEYEKELDHSQKRRKTNGQYIHIRYHLSPI